MKIPDPLLPDSHPPIRGLRDIEALERVPLESRIFSWNVNDWIRRGWELDPGKVAIHFLQRADPEETPFSLTYDELRRRSTQAANLFHALGMGPTDAVLYVLPTVPQLFYAQLGGLAAGIACCVNWMLRPAQVLDLVRNAGTRVLVVLGPTPGYEVWESIQSIRAELPRSVKVLTVQGPGGERIAESDFDSLCARQPDDRLLFERAVTPDDVAGYVHSGGTTGSPKLVKLTHRGFCFKCWANPVIADFLTPDTVFAINPPFHIAGFFGRGILPVSYGMTMVSPSPQGARDRNFITHHWKLVEKYGVTHFGGVPTTLSLLAKNPPKGEDISRLKAFGTAGSAALPAEIGREFERMIGIRTLLIYGSTETTQSICQPPRDGDPRYGSSGIRFPYSQVKAVKLDRAGEIERECAPGEAGVIVVKGPSVTPGYVDPKHNEGVFTREGYFKSGDIGRFDQDGYLWITGRVKDLIIRSGHNIEPAIIEDALLRHPEVVLAAAVAKPDAYAGELPIAYVQLVKGAKTTGEQLAAFALQHISERPAAPKEVIVLERMPLTDVEKPDKVKLRQDAAERAYRAALADALGADARYSVCVRPDEMHGTVVDVSLAATDTEARAELERRVHAVMKAYTAHYVIGSPDAAALPAIPP
jgi:fatty-acyl-CoA synthase